jgi:signal transduction histidine kinase/DNA-binding response OmpR family regulator
MTENNFEQYQKRVDELGQALLDVIASVSVGDFEVEINIPEEIEVFSQLAVGLESMIEDLRELAIDKERSHAELEHKISERTKDLESTLASLQSTQQQLTSGEWQNYTSDQGESNAITLTPEGEITSSKTWMPVMDQAVQNKSAAYEANGKDAQTLALPIQLQDEVIGVIGFNRKNEESWSPREIATVEAIAEQVGLALENQRLFDRTQAALAEADTLYQATSELNTAQNYIDILQVLKKYSALGQRAVRMQINLFNQPATRFHRPDNYSVIAQLPAQDVDAPLTIYSLTAMEALFDKVLDPDNISQVDDFSDPEALSSEVNEVYKNQMSAESVSFIPLVVAGRWIGFVDCIYQEEQLFSEDDNRRTTTISSQASVAIQNIGLIEETSRRANQLETAAEIAQQASSTLDTGALLNRAVNLIRDRFGFYHSSIFLIDEDSAVVAASTGEAGRQLVESNHTHKIEQGGSIIGHVCDTGQPLIVNDLSLHPSYRPHPLLQETKAELGIPLKIGDRVTGALDVQSTKENVFTPDDVAVLQTLASQIAIALENARSYELSQQAVEDIREVDRLKSEFLANMSHELRTPLNSIIGFSRVIIKGIDGPITDLQEQDLQAIHHSGQHLLDMINNILDVSKIEAGKMEINIEEVELPAVIDGVIATARGLVKEKPIQLLNNTPDELPLVNADRTRVRQIMLNLLQNAAKFTDEGSIVVSVDQIMDPSSQKPFLKIMVEDTGIGISDDDQDKLFERFSQVDSSLTRKVGGTGLGLSITKHLVEMQGGEINVESTVDQGSSFWFTLPVVKDEIVEIPAPVEDIPDGAKIIISIDDDENVIDLYRRYLSSHGYHVIAITDPVNVIEQIQTLQPFAITLDIMMPNKDGWQVIEEIKSNPLTAHIPVIICSIVEERDRAYQLGAVDYLVKPILEDDMTETFKRLNLSTDKEFNEILVIDDDPNVFQLVEIALRNEAGYMMRYANGGFAGLESLKSSQPSAVILDLKMPDLDGFSILETMQDDPLLRDIPVIILTAAELTPEERETIEKSKREVLKKDVFKGEQLIKVLEKALLDLSDDNKE